MDTKVDKTDRALQQLKRLREGRGLSADRISSCPDLLSATGTSDVGESYEVILSVLERMTDSAGTKALRVDFGLNLAALLGREPVERELDFLGERRSAYAEIVKRDVKTLSRWSDKAIAELRGQLITDQFDGQIVVAAAVKDRRVTGIEIMQYERSDTGLSHGRNTGYPNPENSSLPLVLFGFPRDWRPINIRFAVAFMGEDYPSKVWAVAADSVMDVSFGHERFELEIDEGMARCRIDNPRRDQLYGVWWEWTSDSAAPDLRGG